MRLTVKIGKYIKEWSNWKLRKISKICYWLKSLILEMFFFFELKQILFVLYYIWIDFTLMDFFWNMFCKFCYVNISKQIYFIKLFLIWKLCNNKTYCVRPAYRIKQYLRKIKLSWWFWQFANSMKIEKNSKFPDFIKTIILLVIILRQSQICRNYWR